VDCRGSLIERARTARTDRDIDAVGGEGFRGRAAEPLAGREDERYARRASVPAKPIRRLRAGLTLIVIDEEQPRWVQAPKEGEPGYSTMRCVVFPLMGNSSVSSTSATINGG
jgi:hypothetical protein